MTSDTLDEFVPGTWFAVPLRDGRSHTLGLTVSADPGFERGILAAFFGRYDHAPTLDDAAGVRPEDAVAPDPAHGLPVIRIADDHLAGGWQPLGSSDDVDPTVWFGASDASVGVYHRSTSFYLTRALVPGWTPVTDPDRLSSWWFGTMIDGAWHWEERAASSRWLSGLEFGGPIDPVLDLLEQVVATDRVPVELSQTGFGAAELVARLHTAGRRDEQRDALPPISHGVAEDGSSWAGWANVLPDAVAGDETLVRRATALAESALDHLIERSDWLDQLADAEPVGLVDAAMRRVDSLREWLRADWVRPLTRQQLAAENEARSAARRPRIVEDHSDDAARRLPDDVDPTLRIERMTWFGFDDVSDWTQGALQHDGYEAIRAALDAVIDDGEGEEPGASVGIAAADIVARLATGNDPGHGRTRPIGGTVEEAVRDWVEANEHLDVDDDLRALARAATEIIAVGGLSREINDLDDESVAAWRWLIASIDRRLA